MMSRVSSRLFESVLLIPINISIHPHLSSEICISHTEIKENVTVMSSRFIDLRSCHLTVFSLRDAFKNIEMMINKL